MKAANLKGLHTAWFQPCDILERQKPQTVKGSMVWSRCFSAALETRTQWLGLSSALLRNPAMVHPERAQMMAWVAATLYPAGRPDSYSSWLWPGPSTAIAGLWGVNHGWENCLSFKHVNFKILKDYHQGYVLWRGKRHSYLCFYWGPGCRRFWGFHTDFVQRLYQNLNILQGTYGNSIITK